jgi:hypothetical protein
VIFHLFRCQSLAEIARNWEQEIKDLRNFTFLERETQESESVKLQSQQTATIHDLQCRIAHMETEKA